VLIKPYQLAGIESVFGSFLAKAIQLVFGKIFGGAADSVGRESLHKWDQNGKDKTGRTE
jgi:hypothetical protein